MKTITIRLPDVETAMLLEVQKPVDWHLFRWY